MTKIFYNDRHARMFAAKLKSKGIKSTITKKRDYIHGGGDIWTVKWDVENSRYTDESLLKEDVNTQYINAILNKAEMLVNDLDELLNDFWLLPEIDEYLSDEEFECLGEAREIISYCIKYFSNKVNKE